MTRRFFCVEQDRIKFQVEICMTLGEWKALRESLKPNAGRHPAQDFLDMVREMIQSAEKEFYPDAT